MNVSFRFIVLPIESWLAQVDSNHRPRAYQARALTTWAMRHCGQTQCISFFSRLFPRYLYRFGGDDGIRTHDPLLAGQVLSQLSYTPKGLFHWSLKIEQQSIHT